MIELYTSPTPNGHKVSILLEELRVPYQVHPISLSKLEQKEEWFLKLNPNGRIPAIVDSDNGLSMFESGAILIYLADKYGKYFGDNVLQRAKITQWLMFQMSAVGPMQGQANVFLRYFHERVPSVIDRYQNEVKRLYGVLDGHLKDNEYLAAGYSIADIATWPWINFHDWAGISLEPFPSLSRWFDQIEQRPAVQRGIRIPGDRITKPSELLETGKQLVEQPKS